MYTGPLLLLSLAWAASIVLLKLLSSYGLWSAIRSTDRTGKSSDSKVIRPHASPSQSIDIPESLYKDMFYKLHNVEDHPEILSQARRIISILLLEALDAAHTKNHSILSVHQFSATALQQFIRVELDQITLRWRQYLKGRSDGQPRMLFQGTDDAKRWLLRKAPSKYVDGAWLGHIHRVTTPYGLRPITKDAWQVLSEELGDGDLEKNHVHVFQKMLHDIGYNLGPADALDFINHAALDDPYAWKAAVSQLLISIFPNELLPEILGFNMHFEMATLETLIVAKELREVNINPFYFNMHITIDNADSGHTAIACQVVVNYLNSVLEHEGIVAAQKAWRRVQAGFVLSSCLPSKESTNHSIPYPNSTIEDPFGTDLLRIFESKAVAASGLHEHCRVNIGGRSLSVWLEPESFKSKTWQIDFLTCLSKAKPWVYRGDSSRSKLVQQLLWGGVMFGAFTQSEVVVLRKWIDNLPQYENLDTLGVNQAKYWPYHALQVDPLDGSVILPTLPQPSQTPACPLLTIDSGSVPIIEKLIPLWLIHPCLLESFICVPWHAAKKTGCAVVRFLRAQHGFGIETSVVAGMDEAQKARTIGLVEIGLDIITSSGLSKPHDLAQVLSWWPSPFAETMLELSVRPRKYKWLLMGLAQVFVHLHQALAPSALLSDEDREALRHIAAREQKALSVCIEDQAAGGVEHTMFWKGYLFGKEKIEECFPSKVTSH